MPTQSTTYNTRLTDEALEKRFRDTFRSQGGAELVDDLYASGVIVPIVDFTAAAEGSFLRSDLQTAWDFSTGSIQITATTNQTIINNAGFWLVDLTLASFVGSSGTSRLNNVVSVSDGTTTKPVWASANVVSAPSSVTATILEDKFVVFLRSGDSLVGRVGNVQHTMDVWYRQIADVSGNFTNPTGFVFS